jgi:membrane protein YqaA with SNARE-associated domain
MDVIHEFFSNVYNVPELIRLVGFYGLILIVFAETGLLVGFFLPGDSLLITAGLFAARGDFDYAMLLLALIPAAIIGNATGYYIGHRSGKTLYSRPDSLLFRREHLRMTHEYYEKHGGKTIILAQFISDPADVRAGRRRCWRDGLPPVRDLQRGGRHLVGRQHAHRRLSARQRHSKHRVAHSLRRRCGDLHLAAATRASRY